MKPFSILILTLALAVPLAAGSLPAEGTEAPGFTLTTDAGSEASLADYRGKWVVLYFYPKDFTSGCTIQAQGFQRDLAEYEKRGAVVLGVSVDTADSHKSFCQKEGLKYTLLSDETAAVSEAYGSVMEYNGAKLSARNTFLIDPKGKIVKVFEKVKPVGHSEAVIAALDEAKQ